MDIFRDSNPEKPARDMELTALLLQDVAERRSPPTLRVFTTGPTVAFGKQDSFRSGFERATRSALLHGFEPVIRQAGGHAVAYDQESVIVELVRSETQSLGGVETRFMQLSELISASLGQLGVELELGELPGEYCPGRFSLHLPAGPKVAGIAQRVIRGASLTTAVITVGSSQQVAAVTQQVYSNLNLTLDVSTIGAIVDHAPGIAVSQVANTLAELAAAELASTSERRRIE